MDAETSGGVYGLLLIPTPISVQLACATIRIPDSEDAHLVEICLLTYATLWAERSSTYLTNLCVRNQPQTIVRLILSRVSIRQTHPTLGLILSRASILEVRLSG